ncbi:MAG: 30S ribosomal protein S9 [Deltaproteobacteria bacterium]|nr:30S ribosomal protein S9 [Deltaproteobacteria bacterium]
MSKTLVQFSATGRRKCATARVFLRPGTGRITVNGLDLDRYFERETSKMILRAPLELVESASSFDAIITVVGGGKSGQAGAVRHGLARALTLANPEWRAPLKKAGFLTRDARMVERKKYGRSGARKRFQYSKR